MKAQVMICLRTILCFLISAGWVGQWAQADELPAPPGWPDLRASLSDVATVLGLGSVYLESDAGRAIHSRALHGGL